MDLKLCAQRAASKEESVSQRLVDAVIMKVENFHIISIPIFLYFPGSICFLFVSFYLIVMKFYFLVASLNFLASFR